MLSRSEFAMRPSPRSPPTQQQRRVYTAAVGGECYSEGIVGRQTPASMPNRWSDVKRSTYLLATLDSFLPI